MKQKKAGRTSQRQREKRRYPFNESTKLIELVDKKHYGDVVKLIERLKPYLTDGEKGAFSLTLGDIRDRPIRFRKLTNDDLDHDGKPSAILTIFVV